MMARYGVETQRSPEEVIQKAVAYFGEGGLGLSVSEEDPCCVTLLGGGGHVFVAASHEEGKTEVELETREWDYHVKKFMGQL
jgi:hypothetical protein